MDKTLRINSCWMCRNQVVGVDNNYCKHDPINWKDIDVNPQDEIPSWCPLPNWTEDDKNELLTTLDQVVSGIEGLMSESTGIAHFYGEVTPWGCIVRGEGHEDWKSFIAQARAIIEKAK